MATITAAKTRITEGKTTFLWETLTTTNDNGSPVEVMGAKSLSMDVRGAFGAGGNVQLQGSNDGVTYNVIYTGATPLNVTADGVYVLSSAPRFVRPFISGGDGTTNIDVILSVTG